LLVHKPFLINPHEMHPRNSKTDVLSDNMASNLI
jgi:hypothetical protein